MRPRVSVLALLAIPWLAACNQKTLTVESDTAWEGEITGYGIFAGTGSTDIDLDDAPSSFCWSFKKSTSAGTLRAYLHEEDWLGLRSSYIADAVTQAPGGEIGGCYR